MLDLTTFTEAQLHDLAVAVDKQQAVGAGQTTDAVDVPACNTTHLQRAIREIEEHNGEGSYWTGQVLINELRAVAGLEPGPVYNDRAAQSHYG